MNGYKKEMSSNYGKSSEVLGPIALVAKDIHKKFDGHSVLEKENVSINYGDKIGLVGTNGSGKTTLIKILAGIEPPDRGKVISNAITIGYLPQDFTIESERTVFEVATQGVSNLIKALDEFEFMSKNYQVDDPSYVSKYNYLLNLLQSNNAFDLPEKVVAALNYLNVGREIDSKVSTLSGGQTMRLALARILISKPNILLLDEPTNHLDLHANLWLREFLSEWSGGLLVVSHDRDFLNDGFLFFPNQR
ncbi:hypothetical protein A2972_00930 [Candidatus Amesbacteria bacterium RIFCSPLOWO2_01_FULL_47_33]|uniref:Vga protein, ATP-binding cassette, subfamily F, member 3 n=2 Tax=Microgenomates group TaxID=1794810 RepID=A0A0H4T0A7_9BACT|nr:vga protein, ATP-binding cassette, subfamily F, member 3 [uncultured Microgenomates bacterium Rifle_16ft_4_minimus_1180]OGD00696.1 MAG: hypothetical protein A2972_00930 [Candidatus Amesbacteria bacterium RIFCSPLOWO2_01_FULL_47_33]